MLRKKAADEHIKHWEWERVRERKKEREERDEDCTDRVWNRQSEWERKSEESEIERARTNGTIETDRKNKLKQPKISSAAAYKVRHNKSCWNVRVHFRKKIHKQKYSNFRGFRLTILN